MMEPYSVLILGKGKSALSSERLVRAVEPQAAVYFYDDDPSKSDFKSVRELLKISWKKIIVSPGFPKKSWLSILENTETEFTQELNLAASLLTDEKIYAITGSVGKSTSVWVADQVLKKSGKKVFLGGNFGIPLADYIFELKESKREKVDIILLELSSYQTERMNFYIDRGLILNLIPNHLDRYEKLEDYYLAKLRMQSFCREACWALNPGGDLYQFAFERGMIDKFRWVDSVKESLNFEEALLLGQHNRENLAALAAFLPSDTPEAFNNLLCKATALPHRIELFEKNKKYFVNDSKATTLESILKAHSALRERFKNERIYWLLGGKDKKLPWNEIKKMGSDKQITFVFFGQARQIIEEQTSFVGESYSTLKEALSAISSRIKEKELCVLSPGGTSLDEFKSFEERGDFFKSFFSVANV